MRANPVTSLEKKAENTKRLPGRRMLGADIRFLIFFNLKMARTSNMSIE